MSGNHCKEIWRNRQGAKKRFRNLDSFPDFSLRSAFHQLFRSQNQRYFLKPPYKVNHFNTLVNVCLCWEVFTIGSDVTAPVQMPIVALFLATTPTHLHHLPTARNHCLFSGSYQCVLLLFFWFQQTTAALLRDNKHIHVWVHMQPKWVITLTNLTHLSRQHGFCEKIKVTRWCKWTAVKTFSPAEQYTHTPHSLDQECFWRLWGLPRRSAGAEGTLITDPCRLTITQTNV